MILGGEISPWGERLLAPLHRMMEEGCFGREKGWIPEIEMAALGCRAGMIGAASLL